MGTPKQSVPQSNAFILPIGFTEYVKTLAEEDKIYSQYLTEMPYGCSAI
jgi:hypothetical protein